MKHSLRPTQQQLREAVHRKLRDVIGPDLRVLFCGINPGLYSTAAGHHFARPGNRFWPTLYASGFTPRLFEPFQDGELIELGLGITNIAARTTATADQLTKAELLHGAKLLRRKVLHFRPAFLAVVGLGAYRTAFERLDAVVGMQAKMIGSTHIWLLPNTSGLNAHHQPGDLARLFGQLREHAWPSEPHLPRIKEAKKRT